MFACNLYPHMMQIREMAYVKSSRCETFVHVAFVLFPSVHSWTCKSKQKYFLLLKCLVCCDMQVTTGLRKKDVFLKNCVPQETGTVNFFKLS